MNNDFIINPLPQDLEDRQTCVIQQTSILSVSQSTAADKITRKTIKGVLSDGNTPCPQK